MDSSYPFNPGQLGPLQLRNRVIRAGTFEGMTPDGEVSDALVQHHSAVARGGVGLCTVAYCSVAKDGLTFPHQLWMRDAVEPGLRRLTESIHAAGAKVALQLGHAGDFASPAATGTRPRGPSKRFNLFTFSRAAAADEQTIQGWIQAYADGAARAVDCGFDAVELHFGHGYLISQFLSPWTNRRDDAWGGDDQRRQRLAREVLEAVRDRLGQRAAILIKMNLEDGFEGGAGLEQAISLAQACEARGADALVLSGGFVSKTPFYMLRGELPVKEMVRNEARWHRRAGLTLFGRMAVPHHPYEDLFFLDLARQVRPHVGLPLVLLGGIRSLAQLQQAGEEGFEFVSMGRPLIHDAELINKMQRGELAASPCEPCNRCVAEMEHEGIRCTHPELGTSSAGDV
jgi:2,4-dienoyl-CoA reductase-like NADH-dependent reductase (Old Yellow Enzyme family)